MIKYSSQQRGFKSVDLGCCRTRGVDLILSGQFARKETKKIRRMRKKENVGAGRSESKSVETTVSRSAGNSAALRSAKQKGVGVIPAETPTSSACA